MTAVRARKLSLMGISVHSLVLAACVSVVCQGTLFIDAHSLKHAHSSTSPATPIGASNPAVSKPQVATDELSKQHQMLASESSTTNNSIQHSHQSRRSHQQQAAKTLDKSASTRPLTAALPGGLTYDELCRIVTTATVVSSRRSQDASSGRLGTAFGRPYEPTKQPPPSRDHRAKLNVSSEDAHKRPRDESISLAIQSIEANESTTGNQDGSPILATACLLRNITATLSSPSSGPTSAALDHSLPVAPEFNVSSAAEADAQAHAQTISSGSFHFGAKICCFLLSSLMFLAFCATLYDFNCQTRGDMGENCIGCRNERKSDFCSINKSTFGSFSNQSSEFGSSNGSLESSFNPSNGDPIENSKSNWHKSHRDMYKQTFRSYECYLAAMTLSAGSVFGQFESKSVCSQKQDDAFSTPRRNFHHKSNYSSSDSSSRQNVSRTFLMSSSNRWRQQELKQRRSGLTISARPMAKLVREIFLSFSVRQSASQIFSGLSRPASVQRDVTSGSTSPPYTRLEANSKSESSSREAKIGDTNSLHGLRFLSMIWVIVMHSYSFALNWITFTEESAPNDIYKTLSGQFLFNGSFACDTFLLIGGFLLAYLAFPMKTGDDTEKSCRRGDKLEVEPEGALTFEENKLNYMSSSRSLAASPFSASTPSSSASLAGDTSADEHDCESANSASTRSTTLDGCGDFVEESDGMADGVSGGSSSSNISKMFLMSEVNNFNYKCKQQQQQATATAGVASSINTQLAALSCPAKLNQFHRCHNTIKHQHHQQHQQQQQQQQQHSDIRVETSAHRKVSRQSSALTNPDRCLTLASAPLRDGSAAKTMTTPQQTATTNTTTIIDSKCKQESDRDCLKQGRLLTDSMHYAISASEGRHENLNVNSNVNINEPIQRARSKQKQHQQVEQKQVKFTSIQVLSNILHRYIRMMPLMMAIIGINTNLLRYLGDGPNWNSSTMMFDQWCRKNWWLNALSLHNFIDSDHMCLSHSWYSAVDIQLFLYGQIILLILFRSKKVGISICIISMLCSQLFTGVQTFIYKLPTVPLLANFSLESMNYYYGEIYIKPYCRASPYLIGILLAYFMRTSTRLNRARLERWQALAGWILALVVMLAIVLAPQPVMNGKMPSFIQLALYSSLSRPIWSCAIAWIIFASMTGHGGFLAKFLAAKCFIPFSRLNYPVFLIHPVVMAVFYGNQLGSFHFSHYLMIYLILGNIVITYVIAFILSALFELPILTLERAVKRHLSSSNTPLASSMG